MENNTYSIYDNSTGTSSISGGNVSGTSYGIFVNKATSWTINGTANISKLYASGVTVNIQGGNIGIIDNSSGSNIVITAGTIESTTDRTISNAGTLRISGGTIRSSNKYAIYNGGTVTITGGTIISTGSTAIYNYGSKGNLTIGEDDASIPSLTVPQITGYTYGVQNKATFSFYDGVITGQTLAISGSVTNLPQNYKVKYENHNTKATLTIRGNTDNVVYYDGQYQQSIETAITLINNSASKKGTIFINADLMPENQIVIPEGTDITFVMQGYSIVYDGADAAILNNGTLTIVDDEVEGTIDPDIISMVINTNGLAVQNNGQLILGIDGTPNNTNSPIILGGVSGNTPTIYDGEVRSLDTSGD